MGELNWGLLSDGATGNALVSGIESGQKQRAYTRKAALEEKALAGQEEAGNALAKGDYAGASTAALKSGNTELFTAVQQASKAHREQLADMAQSIGTVAFGLKKLPPEQRAAALAAAAPTLKQHGVTDDVLASANLTDEGLDGYVAQALTLKDAVAQANADRTFDHTIKKDARDFDYKVKNDDTTHDLTRRGQDITVRGQNLTDARASSDTYRPLTDQEKKDNNLPLEGSYQINGKGKIDRVAGNNAVRPIPGSALAGIQNNTQTIAKIDRAIEALKKNPDAVGLKTYAGDTINQRLDPGGVDVRAMIADIGSQKMHDRSGAAVTITEAPRLTPFIPSVHDRADNAITKLEQLKKEYLGNVEEAKAFYSPEAGYMSLDRAAPTPRDRAPAKPAPTTAPKGPKVGYVQSGYRFTGGDPADKSNWEKLR